MTTDTKTGPLARLRHHVTGAIERGEAQAIEEIPAGSSADCDLCGRTAKDRAMIAALPALVEALRGLLARAGTQLDQSASMCGLGNADALAQARSALAQAGINTEA